MAKIERLAIVSAVVVPFVGLCLAIVLLWGSAVSLIDLSAFLIGYFLTGIGITVGYHRLFSHRSFETRPTVRAALAVLGSMSAEGPVLDWTADHRKHHKFTDSDGDPHSPYTNGGDGWRAVLGGLFHAHVGWLLNRRDRASARRYVPDLVADPVMRVIDRTYALWVTLGLAIPFVYGFLLGGFSVAAGLTAFLWGGLVRLFAVQHATWTVNSICHMYGKQPFDPSEAARNNWGVAAIAFGEGWHHNHHVFPTSANIALGRRQFDPGYAFIRLLRAVGLASNVRTPSTQQLHAREDATGTKLSRTDASRQRALL